MNACHGRHRVECTTGAARGVLVGLAMLTGIGQAAAPDRAWPSVVVAPLLDVPMRDTSICRGPDDAYYLTGTLGPDFDNAKQIRVWQSKDLKSWKELGVAWDIEKDVHKSGRSTWQTYWQMPQIGRAHV